MCRQYQPYLCGENDYTTKGREKYFGLSLKADRDRGDFISKGVVFQTQEAESPSTNLNNLDVASRIYN